MLTLMKPNLVRLDYDLANISIMVLSCKKFSAEDLDYIEAAANTWFEEDQCMPIGDFIASELDDIGFDLENEITIYVSVDTRELTQTI